MNGSFLAVLTAAALTISLSPIGSAQESPSAPPSDLRVLFVGHDPKAPQLTFADDSPRTRELYAERSSLFEAFLGQHFESLTVINAQDYEVTMSDQADVTIFDARPRVLRPEVNSASGYTPASYLPLEFDRPALMISENSPLLGEALGSKLDWL